MDHSQVKGRKHVGHRLTLQELPIDREDGHLTQHPGQIMVGQGRRSFEKLNVG